MLCPGPSSICGSIRARLIVGMISVLLLCPREQGGHGGGDWSQGHKNTHTFASFALIWVQLTSPQSNGNCNTKHHCGQISVTKIMKRLEILQELPKYDTKTQSELIAVGKMVLTDLGDPWLPQTFNL